MKKVMKIKKNIAILMSFLMVLVTLNFNDIYVKAATVYVEEDTYITADSADSYVVSPNTTNGEVTLTVGSVVSGDVTLGGGYPGIPYLINNGTINGTVYANVSNMADVTIENNGYIESLIAGDVYSITGEGTYGTINVNNPSGAINLNFITVKDSITLDATTASNTNSIYVDVHTNVNLPYEVLLLSDVQANDSITMDGDGNYVYTFTSGSIASNYGCKVTINPGEGWEISSDSASGNKYWYGDSIPSVSCMRLPGYSAPTGTNYGVISSGSGTISTSFVDNELTLDYTLAAQGTEAGEIVINLPDLTELVPGTVDITMAESFYVNDEIAPTVSTTAYTGDPTIEYAVSGSDTYTTAAPTTPGNYTVRVSYDANYNYAAYSKTIDFQVKDLEDGVATFDVPNIYEGQEIEPEYSTTTNNAVIEQAEITYSVRGEDDFTINVPVAIGDYTAKLYIPATGHYKEIIETCDFSILEKMDGLAEITVADIYHGEELEPQCTTTTNTGKAPTVYYKLQSEGEEAYQTEAPTAVGDYNAKVVYPATAEYKEAVDETTFSIMYLQGTGNVSVEDVYVGTPIEPQYSTTTNLGVTPTVEYKLASRGEETYDATIPIAVGEYNIRVIYPATESYDELELIGTFNIKALETGDGTIDIKDVYVGTSIVPVVASTKNGTTDVEVEYRLVGEEAYTKTIPTAVGKYEARATFAATPVYAIYVAQDTFEIKALEKGIGVVTVDDVYVGTAITTSCNSITNTDKPIIEYKKKAEPDFAYSIEAPVEIGEYIVRATFPANSVYDQLVVTDEFVIKDFENGVATLDVSDVICGITINPVIGSDTNGVDNATIYYKAVGEDDSAYTTTKPTSVGEYLAKAVFQAVGIYKEVVVSDEFTISYLTIPSEAYSVEGTLGSNEYYTSEIVIKAKEGYLISDTFGKNYREQLVVEASVKGMTVYFMNKETGELTDGMVMEDLYIDIVAPAINAVDSTVYYGDKVDIALTDDNLTRIMVNGEEITEDSQFMNNNILTLESEGGITEYTIEVWDVAGNKTTTTISVASEWTKLGVIPEGVAVKLQANSPYSFGDGEWSVEGDDTSYSGNITFYVQEEDKFVFSQNIK